MKRNRFFQLILGLAILSLLTPIHPSFASIRSNDLMAVNPGGSITGEKTRSNEFELSTENDEETLTTPELIEQAYQRGEISKEERLLNLAYAVYDYNSLPLRFHSNTPWSGTQVVVELNQAARAATKNLGPLANSAYPQEWERLLAPNGSVCKSDDGPGNLDSAHFHLNYFPVTGLSINDYATALESSYITEVSSYNWGAPPYTVNNPWVRYPVQVDNLGGGLYGYVTSNGGLYTGFIGNNPNTTATETDAWATCMVLNANYTIFSGGALKSLQSTAAHEYFHSIQFGLGDPLPEEDLMWIESMAAYVEDEVFDSANDNYRYLWPDFNSCLGEYNSELVYSNWLFFRYAAERNGGTNLAGGGEDVTQAFIANIAAGQRSLTAFQNALNTKGANLPDTFHNYAISTRFMRGCPDGSPYCYEEAAAYLAAAGNIYSHGSVAVNAGVYTGAIVNNYGLNWVDISASGPISVTLTNISAGPYLRASLAAAAPDGIHVTSFPLVIGNGASTSIVNYNKPPGTYSLVAVITNQSLDLPEPSVCTSGEYQLKVTQPFGLLQLNYLPVIFKMEPPPPPTTSMTGRITYHGNPAASQVVKLIFYDGSQESEVDTMTTNSQGNYTFQNPPQLTGNQAMYALWENPGQITSYLWKWWCDDITASTPTTNYTCNFDIQNIQLVSPADGDLVQTPVFFEWIERSLTSDSYVLHLFDPNDGNPSALSDPLGYSYGYILYFPPDGFDYFEDYAWEVLILGDYGIGASLEARNVMFSNQPLNPEPSPQSTISEQSRLIQFNRQRLDTRQILRKLK